MATCFDCGQEMTAGVGCLDPEYEIGGHAYSRIPNDPDQCHDCAAPAGELHHPGCDSERCPACGGQAISCDCEGDDDAV